MCRENKSMMRKIKTLYSRTLLLRAMACGLILTVLLNLAGFSAQCAALEENIVRLHVIANSNDEADQAVKLRVRDAVLRDVYKRQNITTAAATRLIAKRILLTQVCASLTISFDKE